MHFIRILVQAYFEIMLAGYNALCAVVLVKRLALNTLLLNRIPFDRYNFELQVCSFCIGSALALMLTGFSNDSIHLTTSLVSLHGLWRNLS
jgi:hypothetical protein